MPLNPQDRLGPYEILSLLGQGGMGEVYAARDTRLQRHVAIKVLRGDTSTAAGARFEREAQAVAALNHPNIVSLFEIGRENGIEFTVSELVEGQNLRKLLESGPMTIRQAVDFAAQLADGLAAAHAAGIVHRDLKPENVMVTPECRIKILDFGLARQGAAPVFGLGSSAGETMAVITDNATEYRTTPGMVLGTATYMSPEQARGEEADYRSDQFALGLIIYEMLSGRPAFAHPSAIETMAAIVRDDPAPLPENVRAPAPLLWILERLLEKDRRNRFDSTRDLYNQLRAIDTHWSSMSGTAVHPAVAAAAAPTRSRLALPAASRKWLAAALVTGLIVGAALAWLLHPRQLDLKAYSYRPFAVQTTQNAVWSPDGQSLLYAAHVKQAVEIFLGKEGQNPLQLTHTGSFCRGLAFSADGVHVFFYCEAIGDTPAAIYRVSTVGGQPERLLDVPGALAIPALSPGGADAAMLGRTPDGANTILVSSPLGAPWKEYSPATFRPRIRDILNDPRLAFSPDGKKLLFIVNGNGGEETDWVLPWPSGSGTPRQINLDVPRNFFTPDAAWMPDSEHLVLASTPDGMSTHLYLGKPGGSFRQITMGSGYEAHPAVSADGRTIAYVTGSSDYNIVSASVADGTVSGLVQTPRNESMPAWSAGSDLMAYVTDRNGKPEIWLHSSDGSERSAVRTSDFHDTVVQFMDPVPSPDGQRIVYAAILRNGTISLWMSPVAGGTPVRVTNNTGGEPEMAPNWSPDSSRIVYMGARSGQLELFLVGSGGASAPTALYTFKPEAGGVMPSWIPGTDHILTGEGKKLFTIAAAGGKTQPLAPNLDVDSLAVSRDGKTAYSIRMDGHTPVLFSLDLDTHAVHDIKRLPPEDEPSTNLNPGKLFTLSPDGKTLAYTTGTNTSSIWLLRGFPQP